MRQEPECMSEKIYDVFVDQEYQKSISELLIDPQAACDALPDEEKQAYRDAQQSVVDARLAGARLAHTIFII